MENKTCLQGGVPGQVELDLHHAPVILIDLCLVVYSASASANCIAALEASSVVFPSTPNPSALPVPSLSKASAFPSAEHQQPDHCGKGKGRAPNSPRRFTHLLRPTAARWESPQNPAVREIRDRCIEAALSPSIDGSYPTISRFLLQTFVPRSMFFCTIAGVKDFALKTTVRRFSGAAVALQTVSTGGATPKAWAAKGAPAWTGRYELAVSLRQNQRLLALFHPYPEIHFGFSESGAPGVRQSLRRSSVASALSPGRALGERWRGETAPLRTFPGRWIRFQVQVRATTTRSPRSKRWKMGPRSAAGAWMTGKKEPSRAQSPR
jgi:hypothetical protein